MVVLKETMSGLLRQRVNTARGSMACPICDKQFTARNFKLVEKLYDLHMEKQHGVKTTRQINEVTFTSINRQTKGQNRQDAYVEEFRQASLGRVESTFQDKMKLEEANQEST